MNNHIIVSHNDQESDRSSFSYTPSFKDFIDEDSEGNSELFFIRCSEKLSLTEAASPSNQNAFRNEYKRMSLRRNRGVLSKISKKNQQNNSVKVKKVENYSHADGSLLKEFTIVMEKNKNTKLKLRKSKTINANYENMFETLFNASIVLIDKKLFIKNVSESSVFKSLQGDNYFIKFIDKEIISPENINSMLKRIQNKFAFTLTVCGENVNDLEHLGSEQISISKSSDIISNRSKLFLMDTSSSNEIIFSLIVITKNEQETSDSEDFTTMFSYPPKERNFLHKLKGSFLTIQMIMKSSFSSPNVTVINFHDTKYFITTTVKDETQFIILSFNANYVNRFDVAHHTTNILKYLDYVFPDALNLRSFEELLTICDLIQVYLSKQKSDIDFENLFSCSNYVPLPKEIVLRMNDSLSELEAMDYRNWNETLIELFGKFNIIGSCMFYKTFQICSHFNKIDMENIELFIKFSCIKLIYTHCNVREIAIWKRVYPKDYQSFNGNNDARENKVFLLILAHGNLMMSVLLEENSFNSNPETAMQNSNYLIYFLEEMDDILDHMNFVGIENLTKIWINSLKRPLCENFLEQDDGASCVSDYFKTIREEDDDTEFDYGSQKSSSGFDITEFSDAIYKDFSDIFPQTLTFGTDNCLINFIQLDESKGILITPMNEQDQLKTNDRMLNIFRSGCIKIHKLLQNTSKFNIMFSRETNKFSHKSTSMMPIKEHGLMIQEKTSNGNFIDLWIIGRLFGSREVFVCFNGKTPQNMIEMAFRISINCIG
ncbi:CLUMA_CG004544, isoform A [Clunio marinus]|uniref:CLUMA_CG004544, isoform A n=1 Tax=Clunio marinus TaxID=568069 RepID=A0A1J1HWF8_9DIPT|nr:CLUMA_CG004544, isoform A [Clunio marinus]